MDPQERYEKQADVRAAAALERIARALEAIADVMRNPR